MLPCYSIAFHFFFYLTNALALASLLCMHDICHVRYTHALTKSILMYHHTHDDNNAVYSIRQQKSPINGSYFCPRSQLRPNPPSIIKSATGNQNHHNGNKEVFDVAIPGLRAPL